MVHATDYITVSTFVKVTQRKLWTFILFTVCCYVCWLSSMLHDSKRSEQKNEYSFLHLFTPL